MLSVWILAGLGAAIGALLYLRYIGLFSSVAISVERFGPKILAYADHVGAYRKVCEPINSTIAALKELGIEDPDEQFGLFLDNPRQVKEESLRSVGGCIVPAMFLADLEVIKQRVDHLSIVYNKKALVARFPARSRWSIPLGVFKVYPAILRYARENNVMLGPIMELYDMAKKETLYVVDPEGSFHKSA